MPTTQPMFHSLSADLFPAPYTLAPPSSGDSVAVSTVASGTSNSLPDEIAVAVAQALQQSLPTFVAAFRAENLAAPFSSAALPPVSSVISSLAMVAPSSLSSVTGTLRLLPFVSTFPAISSTPGSCSACLVDRSSNYGITAHQLFFVRRKFDSVMRQGVCGWPRSRTNSGETGEENYQRRVCGIGQLIVYQSPCSRLRAPGIFGW